MLRSGHRGMLWAVQEVQPCDLEAHSDVMISLGFVT